MERLQNLIARAGVASRRKAAALIETGRISVDGQTVREPYLRVDSAVARVCLDGKRLDLRPERSRTVMLYKPYGVLSTCADPFGGRTVAELVRTPERLVPVGRLDRDSEGLLLMTNDGDLALRLTHPRYGHVKRYEVRVAGRWSEDKLRILRGPVQMPDGYVVRPVPVEVLRTLPSGERLLEFRLGEGRKRQIRYMCSAAHLVVTRLKRVALGALVLPREMQPGEWRDLTKEELDALRQGCG